MSGLNLIASYPKSGNTWVRAVLTSLNQGGGPLDINQLAVPIAADRFFFDDAMEIETSDLLPAEEHRLRPLAYRFVLPQGGPLTLKTHDAWLPAPGAEEPPFPRADIAMVIFIVRDPRDIALSLASYLDVTIDEAIRALASRTFSMGINRQGLRPQLPQYVSSWSRHTESWLGSNLPLHLVRYEDMIATPLETFEAIAKALNYPTVPGRIAAAVAASRFERMQSDEKAKGFRESSPQAPNRFFRSGTAGGWRQKLSDAQVDRILQDHGDTMRRLGYDA
jgi:hypothetical protein